MARSETIPMRVGAPPISPEDPGDASVFYKTAITVVLAFLYYLWWWNNRAPKGHASRFRTRPFRLALVASCCAVVCFVKGLDEDNDPARFFHGCWHIANAASASLLLAALDPVEATRLRE